MVNTHKTPADVQKVVLVDAYGNVLSSSGGVSQQDGTEFVPGTSSGTPAMGLYESTPTSVDDGDIGAIGMTADRKVRVDGSEVTQPVSGTFWQATQPVSAASLPLPSGAATAAKQPALGTAGTPSSDVITVQGVTSMTPLVVDGSAVTQPVSLASVPSHAVTNAGTFAVQADSVAGVAAEGGGVGLGMLIQGDDGTDRKNVAVNATTGNLQVDLGATDNAVLDAIAASLALLDNAIPSGNELQVDVVASLPAGTNAIGKLAANSGVDIGDVDVLSLPATPAGTNLIGIAAVAHNDTYYQGTTSRTIGRAIIDAATSGDNTLLAAQGASNIIRVHSLFLVSAGTVNVRFESGTGGTALTGQMNLVANTGFVLPFNPYGWFQTAANTLLNLELSAAISVDGAFQYSVVQ